MLQRPAAFAVGLLKVVLLVAGLATTEPIDIGLSIDSCISLVAGSDDK